MSCSLTAAELEARVARWRRLAAGALIEAAAVPGGARQRYRRDDAVARELRDLVALEASCCPRVAFTLATEPGALVLEVRGPAAEVALFASAQPTRTTSTASGPWTP